MNRLVVALVLFILLGISCSNPSGSGNPETSQVFLDTFTGSDGSSPAEYTWTGDPRGEGECLIYDNEFKHVEGGHVHYFRNEGSFGSGVYEFDALDSRWGFAWRIPKGNPNEGNCMRLYHRPAGSSWEYVLTTASWWTLSGYPDGQYMWHNGSHLESDTVITSETAGWHHIRIEDQDGQITIYVDNQLLFEADFGYTFTGTIGIGSDGGDYLTPGFDNVSFSEFED